MTAPKEHSAKPSPGGQDALVTDEMVDAACRAYYDTAEDVVAVDHAYMEAALKAALAAQPSPGGQGDLKPRFTEWVKANGYNPATFASGRFMGDGVQIAWEAVQALAARQPVGEPAMYQVRPRNFPAGEGWREVSKRQFDDRGEFPGYPEADWERRTLYAASPAQAVDLGKYRHALLRASGWARRSDVTSHAEDAGLLRELLALIDSKVP